MLVRWLDYSRAMAAVLDELEDDQLEHLAGGLAVLAEMTRMLQEGDKRDRS